MKSPIAKKLLRWYSSRPRNLPWRDNPQPYAVWVAEIMAQQTRLETMLPYYARWMRRFPSIRALARASEQQVLAAWEGLGYYSRARNLRKAAKVVVAKHGGRLPANFDALRALPGIGRYTAGAIASLAFGMDEPAVDGNAIRVLSRIFDIDLVQNSTAAQTCFWQLAAGHLPAGKAAHYNQALMDLGAGVCTPRRPKCSGCPLQSDCKAFALGIQEQRPVKTKSKSLPLRQFAAAVIEQRGRFLVVQRPGSGLLASMWEFPNTAVPSARSSRGRLRQTLKANVKAKLAFRQRAYQFEHTYSHFRARLHVYQVALDSNVKTVTGSQPHRWQTLKQLNNLPMGKLDRRVANMLHKGGE